MAVQQNLVCQRWREHRSTYRPAGETINPADYEIAPISFQEAKTFTLLHHYSASYPVCRYRYGLYSKRLTSTHWQAHGLAPELAGVAVFSVPQHPAVVTNVFPGNPNDSVELGRFVLLNHIPANAETYFIKRCLESLKRKGLRGVVAFADDVERRTKHGDLIRLGHIGTIYQSSAWAFRGRGAKKTLYVFNDDGRTLDRRTISKIRNQESGFDYACSLLTARSADEPWEDPKEWLSYWLPKLTTTIRHPGCLKYSVELRSSNRRRISIGNTLPYPKNFASASAMEAIKRGG